MIVTIEIGSGIDSDGFRVFYNPLRTKGDEDNVYLWEFKDRVNGFAISKSCEGRGFRSQEEAIADAARFGIKIVE